MARGQERSKYARTKNHGATNAGPGPVRPAIPNSMIWNTNIDLCPVGNARIKAVHSIR